MGSGPTRDVWNIALGLRWRRGMLGDWLDAAQRDNGATPYASKAIPAAGRYSISVTSLVARWLANAQNRGFYLRSAGTAWPFIWAGRLHATAEARPTLVVTTSNGTARIAARANGAWHSSTSYAANSSAQFQTNSEGPAIVHFDLRSVTGTLVSAALELSCIDWQHSGSLEILEADPPTFLIPDSVAQPALGIAAETASWAALAAHTDVITATDFNSTSVPSGFTPPAERILNSATGTTYARATIAQGAFDSADVRRDLARGTGPQGTPNVVHEELYGQYWIYFEDDFGTTADTAIKIPAMSVQFGYWNDVGYWQQTTGNGGYPGTGLKVWNAAKNKWEYQGHSVRILTGVRPPDGSNYDGPFAVGFYPYNLDQAGPFPAGEQWPNVMLRRGRWYCIDIRIKQNTMSGAQDANGNYATANADGVMEAWVNGYPAYSTRKAVATSARPGCLCPTACSSTTCCRRSGIGEVLTPAFLAQVEPAAVLRQQREVWTAANAEHEIDRTLAYDWRYTLAESDLPKVRGTTQLAGMQVAFPMLDDDLLAFSMGLPPEYKLKGLKLRWFFKEALRGFLPDEILAKKKQGFGLPFGVWADSHDGLKALAVDSVRAIGERGLVRREFIKTLIDTHLPAHAGYYCEMVWILMMLEQWLRARAGLEGAGVKKTGRDSRFQFRYEPGAV